MPQWDFLNFLAEQAKRYANFQLLMNTEAIGPIEKSGRVVGVEAKTEQGDLNVYADLVVGADGRLSFAKTRFICVSSNFACLSPSQNFRDQNLILL